MGAGPSNSDVEPFAVRCLVDQHMGGFDGASLGLGGGRSVAELYVVPDVGVWKAYAVTVALMGGSESPLWCRRSIVQVSPF